MARVATSLPASCSTASGELRQHYREGQEDQFGALGPVVNVTVLWNSIYMDAALDQLRAEGVRTLVVDLANLTMTFGAHLSTVERVGLFAEVRRSRITDC